jgi:AraC-like DNA-binding protein
MQPQLVFSGEPAGAIYEGWREQFGRQVMAVDLVPLGDGPVHRTIRPAVLPGLRLSASVGTPMSFVSMGMNDDLAIVTSPNSSLLGAIGGRALRLRAGELTMADASVKGACVTQVASGNFRTTLLPRKKLLRACPNAEDLIAQPRSGSDGVAAMFLKYYDLAHAHAAELSPPELDAVSQHLFDLAVLMIGARGSVADEARSRGLSAARFDMLKADIMARLDDSGLSLGSLAAAHRISARTIQAMFEQAGLTYSGFVLEHRLLRAERLLRNPALRQRKIIEIAHMAGFQDLSYFHRAFRRRFGRTPDDVRQTTAGRSGPAGG